MVISITGALTMLMLFLFELQHFMTVTTATTLVVDELVDEARPPPSPHAYWVACEYEAMLSLSIPFHPAGAAGQFQCHFVPGVAVAPEASRSCLCAHALLTRRMPRIQPHARCHILLPFASQSPPRVTRLPLPSQVPCEHLSLDVSDMTGTTRHNITKVPTPRATNPLAALDTAAASKFPTLPSSLWFHPSFHPCPAQL